MSCTKLTSVTIPNSVTEIGDDAFDGCTALTSVTIPNSIKFISNYAFRDCSGLTEITIPNSVTSIGSSAFYGCSGLTEITIPNNVTSIGSMAFYGTGWYNNQSDGLLYLDHWLLGHKGNSTKGEIKIVDETKYIASGAFSYYSGLTSIIIPNSVISIGSGAFSYCTRLANVCIGDGIKTIGNQAFSGCTAMTKLISHAITPPKCGYWAFDGIDKQKCTLSVPEESTAAYQQADEWKDFLLIDNNITSISNVMNSIAAPTHIYDLNGRKLKEPSKGINIIGGKKIIVK